MKFAWWNEIGAEEAWENLPRAVRSQVQKKDLPDSIALASFGVDNKDVVRVRDARSVLKTWDESASLIVVGPSFTDEALGVFREVSARVISMGDFHWTEASLDSVR